jgi:small multidrug resistance pump
MIQFVAGFAIVVSSFLGGVAQVLFKMGTKPLDIWKLGIGIGFYGVAFLIYMVSLRYLSLKVAYPLIALSYIWVVILSNKYLGQPITKFNIVGAIVLIIGIYLVTK